MTGTGGGGGGGGSSGGGGPSMDSGVTPTAAVMSSAKDDVRSYEDGIAKNPYQVSKSAEQGVRWTMEDTYSVANGGHFAAVFDGHGGSGVSGMLRDHVHRLYSKALYQRHGEEIQRSALKETQVDDENGADSMSCNRSVPSIKSHIASIRGSLKRIERESMRHDHFEYQGSTAVVVLVHVGKNGERTLISANIGDSRAILCRCRKAIDLTRDHKPSDEREKARIRSMGEDVQWDPYGEIYRVKDLSLSRAIGDRFAKPVVSSEAEIDCLPLKEEDDEFFLLASDGLWDVMTSQEVVDFVHEMLECPTQSVKTKKGKIVLTPEFRRRKMARFVAHEALERGSADNVCVILVWLKNENK
jgi:protein phosphatase